MTIEQALNQAVQLLQAGRLAEAENVCRAVIQQVPQHPDGYRVLGMVALQARNLLLAETMLRKALSLHSGVAEYHDLLGIILQGLGRFAEAEAAGKQAVALEPTFAGFHNNLGMGYQHQGRWVEAEAAYRQALTLWPNFPSALVNLAAVLQNQNRLAEAEAAFRKALPFMPPSAGTENDLGYVLLAQGRLAEAQDCFRRALTLDPRLTVAHSNALLCEQYVPEVTPAELLRKHAEWEERHGAPLRSAWRPFTNRRDPERPLRLGLVSADLGYHPVGFFLVGLLEALDRAQFQPIVWSGKRQPDDMTQRIRAATADWRETFNVPEEQVAEQIRASGIDLLIDLSGHTGANRLQVFARKPAPVQLTWMGYVGTTGLAAMDYLIADRFHVPAGAEGHYREQVLRLPDGYICWTPPAYAPEVGPLPALQRGHVTFASFNNPLKLNPRLTAVWAEILKRVPGARLLLQYRGLENPVVQKPLRDGFAARGVDLNRLEIRGPVPHPALLPQYHEVDIALDPFPYSGGLTTCEALWMGVPVVTCPGETFASRHSLSHLSNVGLSEMVALDHADYVEKVVALAQDLPRLAALRAGLRERVAAAPLCDRPRFAANFAAALRDVWRRWCATPTG